MSDSKSDELLAEARRVFVRSFAGDFTLPVIARAEGATVTDVDGREYLDFSSGQMCATVGHNHPRIAEAVRGAADRALHVNSAMLSPAHDLLRRDRPLARDHRGRDPRGGRRLR